MLSTFSDNFIVKLNNKYINIVESHKKNNMAKRIL